MKQTSARIFSLMTLLAATTMLGGCYMFNGISNAIAPERPDQNVEGARRAPALNPKGAAAAPVAPVAHAPVPTASRDADPYDAYDTNGNEVAAQSSSSQGGFFSHMMNGITGNKDNAEPHKPIPGNPVYSKDTSLTAPIAPAPVSPMPLTTMPGKNNQTQAQPQSDKAPVAMVAAPVVTPAPQADAAPAPAAPSDQADAAPVPRPWYARIFPANDTAKPDAAAQVSQPDSAPQEVHNVSQNVLPTAADRAAEKNAADKALADKQQQDASAQSAAALAPSASTPDAPKSDGVAPAADASAAPVPDSEQHGKVTFAPYRFASWVGGLFGYKATDNTLPNPDANATAPELSSVPPKPDTFANIKADKPQKMEELQADHAMAQEQKTGLDSEPSQLATTPVAPAAAPAAQTDESKSGGLVLLGHASALPSQGDSDLPPPTPLEKTVPADAPAPKAEIVPEAPKDAPKADVAVVIPAAQLPADPAPVMAAAPVVLQDAPKAEVVVEAPAPQQPAPVMAVAPAAEDAKPNLAVQAPTKQEEPAPAMAAAPEAPPAPVVQAAPEPAATTPAAPVTTVSETDRKPADATASNQASADALPSPTLLEQVSVLPASRYMVRQQASQQNQ